MLLIYFNARDKQSWKFLEIIETTIDLNFVGAFPMEYSASSVVQDNRKGAMKIDYIFVINKKCCNIALQNEFDKIPGWSNSIEKMIGNI